MATAMLPSVEAAYDKVGVYDQDAINGFSDEILEKMLDFVDPAQAHHILDAMAGNGNLTVRLYEYCRQRGMRLPPVSVFEFSQVQCRFAEAHLADTPARVVWGDILTLEDHARGGTVPLQSFDRVMLKSGTHEIPLEHQLTMYQNIWRVLQPGGLFVNLGFVFDDVDERDQFRELTRFKDSLAGLQSAAHNHHFLSREELYTRLAQAGFVDIRGGMHVQYTIRTLVGIQAYFPQDTWEQAYAELQAQQARSLLLRRRGRIHFSGDSSVMLCPGEITIARRPA